SDPRKGELQHAATWRNATALSWRPTGRRRVQPPHRQGGGGVLGGGRAVQARALAGRGPAARLMSRRQARLRSLATAPGIGDGGWGQQLVSGLLAEAPSATFLASLCFNG